MTEKEITLKEWMSGPPSWSLKDLAKEVGCDKTYLCQIKNDNRVPSTDLARKISGFTGGKVKVSTLLKLDE